MAAIKLTEIGKAVVKLYSPSSKIYLAKRSFAPGITPKHLEKYADEFGARAKKCKSEVSSIKAGTGERLAAFRGCMAK